VRRVVAVVRSKDLVNLLHHLPEWIRHRPLSVLVDRPIYWCPALFGACGVSPLFQYAKATFPPEFPFTASRTRLRY
jgi:hypothetical protein